MVWGFCINFNSKCTLFFHCTVQVRCLLSFNISANNLRWTSGLYGGGLVFLRNTGFVSRQCFSAISGFFCLKLDLE